MGGRKQERGREECTLNIHAYREQKCSKKRTKHIKSYVAELMYVRIYIKRENVFLSCRKTYYIFILKSRCVLLLRTYAFHSLALLHGHAPTRPSSRPSISVVFYLRRDERRSKKTRRCCCWGWGYFS